MSGDRLYLRRSLPDSKATSNDELCAHLATSHHLIRHRQNRRTFHHTLGAGRNQETEIIIEMATTITAYSRYHHIMAKVYHNEFWELQQQAQQHRSSPTRNSPGIMDIPAPHFAWILLGCHNSLRTPGQRLPCPPPTPWKKPCVCS